MDVLFLDRANTSSPKSAENRFDIGSGTTPERPVEIVAREGILTNLRHYRPKLEAVVAKMKEVVG